MKKCLIIRFSSFGDIAQAMGVLPSLRQSDFEVHWVTKREFADVVALSPLVHRVWSFDRGKGLVGLVRLAFRLRDEGYTHVYDAHRSMRSLVCSLILRLPRLGAMRPRYLYRPKERWKRFLLFVLGINRFPKPFRGISSFTAPLGSLMDGRGLAEPLQRWDFDLRISKERRNDLEIFADKIVLAPSAAWEMKRWPLGHWIELVDRWPEGEFVLLGGKNDGFCGEIARGRRNVTSLIGTLSLVESCYVVSRARLVVSADTGIIHVADLLGTKGLCLMGPTAFGFPTGGHIKVLEVPLGCRPCSKDGRGRCGQEVYQKCMVDIVPERVLGSAVGSSSSC